MNSFKELQKLKNKADDLNGQVDKVFKQLSNKCTFKELTYHEDHGSEWYNCVHKGYHLCEYTNITPCDKEYCPKLN